MDAGLLGVWLGPKLELVARGSGAHLPDARPAPSPSSSDEDASKLEAMPSRLGSRPRRGVREPVGVMQGDPVRACEVAAALAAPVRSGSDDSLPWIV